MNIKGRARKVVYLAFSIIWILVGIYLIQFAVSQFIDHQAFKVNAVHINGEITNIERIKEVGEDDVLYRVHVGYTVDGIDYNTVISYWATWMDVGDNIELYYDRTNPSDVRTEKTGIKSLLMTTTTGIINMIVGAIIIKRCMKTRRKEYENLKMYGTRVLAYPVDISVDRSIIEDFTHPCRILYEYEDPDGITHRFKSPKIKYTDNEPAIQSTIPVYLDSNDYTIFEADYSFVFSDYMFWDK